MSTSWPARTLRLSRFRAGGILEWTVRQPPGPPGRRCGFDDQLTSLRRHDPHSACTILFS